jgi:hypothetical protein
MKFPLPSPAELIAALTAGSDPHAKALACQQLAIIGGPEVVPTLAGLLADEHLSDYARSALESIADPAAGAALLNALPDLNGRRLAGVIDSLGVRRELAAIPELQKLAGDPPHDAVVEALAALGKIGTPEALATVRTSLTAAVPATRVAAGHAALAAADRLLKDGKRADATALLEAVIAAELPESLRTAATALVAKSRRVSLFDGKTLEGWEGDLTWFRVAEGAVVGGSLTKAIPQNEFLCTRREFGDFELRLKVRLLDGKGNGGIQFRSKRVPNSREMAGYQADMATGYWGGLYDESRRAKFLGTRAEEGVIAKILKPNDWNDYVIRCEGPRVRLWLNGQLTTEFTETDPAIPRTGNIGLQIHGGPPSEAWYKDLEIEELPSAKGK